MSETENRKKILRMCKEAKVDHYRFVFKCDVITYFAYNRKICSLSGTEWFCMRKYNEVYRPLGYVIHDIELIEP